MLLELKPRVLIVYGSWNGQTRRVAERIATIARARGYVADVASARDAVREHPIASFDSFVVCSAIHLGAHHRDVERFIALHREALKSHDSAMVSVSLAAMDPGASEGRRQAMDVVNEMLQRHDWHPAHVILTAGALPYTKYNPLTRWVMKQVVGKKGGPTDTTRDHEFTDWDRLDEDAAELFPQVDAHAERLVDAPSVHAS